MRRLASKLQARLVSWICLNGRHGCDSEPRVKETGDFPQLSRQDISIIALGIETNGQIISDDILR